MRILSIHKKALMRILSMRIQDPCAHEEYTFLYHAHTKNMYDEFSKNVYTDQNLNTDFIRNLSIEKCLN